MATTLADSLVSSSSRPLPIRKRPDLLARRQRYQGRIYWVVKDPVGLQYYRFEEEEYSILQMLDGEASLEQIAEQFEAQFPPQTIKPEELQQFIGTLHRSGLVITSAGGQGAELKKLHDEKKKKQRIATYSNILSIKFKGIDPDRILNFQHQYLGWFWSKQALFFNILLVCSAALLVLVQFELFQSKLPSFQSFFSGRSWENWLLLGVILGSTKVMHEFGHGLSCKYFGGECHEMGIMFLVLTPCLYCNVSDSWMLPNRWHRAAIGAAGMYVEVVLASACTFIWWFTEPGFLNYLCLNIMFVSSVSTILFNANPLLRYDGYYILSDVLEIPNLRQKATSILTRKLGHWCLGIEPPEDPFLPQRHQAIFAVFSVASAIYRWVVLLSILYFLNKVFEPYGLKILGQGIALMSLYGLLVQPLWKLYKYFKVPGRLGKVKRWRFVTSLLVILAVLGGIASVPMPSYVYSSFIVQPRDADGVFVLVDGALDSIPEGIKPGVQVVKGQELARLSNLALEATVTELESQRNILLERLRSRSELSHASNPRDRNLAKSQIASIRKTLEAVDTQLGLQREDLSRLVIRAPRSGVIIPPEIVPDRRRDERELATWYGTPFDKKNLGATLQAGTKFCSIGDPASFEARLVIEQDDRELVAPGQKVNVILRQSAHHRFQTSIEDVLYDEIDVVPTRLSSLSGGDIPTKMDAAGVPRSLTPHFEAFAPLSTEAKHLRVGLVGTAKIETPPRTLFQRIYRYASRTFNFDL